MHGGLQVCKQNDIISKNLAISWSNYLLLQQANYHINKCCVPPPLTKHVTQIVVDVLSFIVNACVLNQSHGHWLLRDALHYAITMNKTNGRIGESP
jgi:hypothetical protein